MYQFINGNKTVDQPSITKDDLFQFGTSKEHNDEETWWPHDLGRPRISGPALPGTWDQFVVVIIIITIIIIRIRIILVPLCLAHRGIWHCKPVQVGLSTCVMKG